MPCPSHAPPPAVVAACAGPLLAAFVHASERRGGATMPLHSLPAAACLNVCATSFWAPI